MADAIANNPDAALASATPYLRLFGLAAGGHYLARGALAVANDTSAPAQQHVALARFFAENLSVAGPGLASAVTSGAQSVLGLAPELATA
jgi:hypothetical protein